MFSVKQSSEEGDEREEGDEGEEGEEGEGERRNNTSTFLRLIYVILLH